MNRTTLTGMGAIALASALSGCQATQTRTESDIVQTAVEAPTASPDGLYGDWRGRWDRGGGDIAITISEAGEERPGVTYCFKERCWEPEDVMLDGATLSFSAQEGLKYAFERDGDRLSATLKKGGRTFRSLMERTAVETVAAAAGTTESTTGAEQMPAQSGLAALAGHWSGKWGGGSPSTLTVTADPESVEYCYRDECWDVRQYTVEDGTLAWDNRGWKFSFTLKGDRVKGKLRNPRGTTRITMKRK